MKVHYKVLLGCFILYLTLDINFIVNSLFSYIEELRYFSVFLFYPLPFSVLHSLPIFHYMI